MHHQKKMRLGAETAESWSTWTWRTSSSGGPVCFWVVSTAGRSGLLSVSVSSNYSVSVVKAVDSLGVLKNSVLTRHQKCFILYQMFKPHANVSEGFSLNVHLMSATHVTLGERILVLCIFMTKSKPSCSFCQTSDVFNRQFKKLLFAFTGIKRESCWELRML